MDQIQSIFTLPGIMCYLDNFIKKKTLLVQNSPPPPKLVNLQDENRSKNL